MTAALAVAFSPVMSYAASEAAQSGNAEAAGAGWKPALPETTADTDGADGKNNVAQFEPPSMIPGFFHPTDKAFVSKYLHDGQYMTVNELKPGMTGYGLTVFH